MRFAAILALLPTTVLAGPYDGVYKQVANADCANVGVDGGALKIEDGIFYGVEVECRMTRPVDVLEMDGTLYTMQCSGGDQGGTERAMIMDSAEDDGIIMIWNGYAFAYAACEPTSD
jgi:hypothetical protein